MSDVGRRKMTAITLTEFGQNEHELFFQQGFLRLGRLLTAAELTSLQQRLDDIMLGVVRYENMRFQLDPAALPDGERGVSSKHVKSTLAYRRIDDLEQDSLFLAYMQHPLFRQITRRYVGEQVAVFRSMFMNKAAGLGTPLQWHQDVGAGWRIDSNPIVTVWTALDAATPASGCMQIVPGSHRHGVIDEGHWLNAEQVKQFAPPARVMDLQAEAGEAILLHNLLIHSSGVNSTTSPRRAFSSTYMDGGTRSLVNGDSFPLIFGAGALKPSGVGHKAAENIQVRHG